MDAPQTANEQTQTVTAATPTRVVSEIAIRANRMYVMPSRNIFRIQQTSKWSPAPRQSDGTDSRKIKVRWNSSHLTDSGHEIDEQHRPASQTRDSQPSATTELSHRIVPYRVQTRSIYLTDYVALLTNTWTLRRRHIRLTSPKAFTQGHQKQYKNKGSQDRLAPVSGTITILQCKARHIHNRYLTQAMNLVRGAVSSPPSTYDERSIWALLPRFLVREGSNLVQIVTTLSNAAKFI